MDIPSSSENSSSETAVLSYSRWQDILRTWFWRYYDNLLKLTLYNLGWFLTCFGIGWFASFLGILGTAQQWNWPVIYLVYVAECAASLGWALAIFKVVMGEAVSWPEILIDLKRYFFKGLISASISGLVLGLAVYNLRFYFSLRVSTHILIFILMGFVATVFIYFLMMTFYQWPILFFQNPALPKLFYRSFIITLGTGPVSLLVLFISAFAVFFFVLQPFLWFFIGFVFLFTLYTVSIEKHFLRYKITYQDKPIADYLESADAERQRGWRDIFKPWETR